MNLLNPSQLEELRQLGTCIVASAIETFDVRLPNTGFTDSSIKCMFTDRSPVIGYAVTGRMRSYAPPIEGGSYYDRSDWWSYILQTPAPRMVVIQDIDRLPGVGAFVGEVHASILMALGCTGLVTNGAVRDLPQIHETGFQLFAGNVSVSHAYSHIFEFGGAVEVGKLHVRPGDLIQGDVHGVLTIPSEVADKVPAVAERILQRRRQIIDVCQSSDFTIEKLAAISERLGTMKEHDGVNPKFRRGIR